MGNCICHSVGLVVLLAFTWLHAASAADDSPPSEARPTVWRFQRLDALGDHKATVLGEPRLIETPQGPAIEFDGKDDALFVDVNPLAGLKQLTVEVVFRPDRDGPKEQRFLHFQENETESRLLFETRLTDDGRWFLDTYVKAPRGDCTLFAEKSLHAIGPWYHAAVVIDGKRMRHYVNGKEELQADLAYEAQKAGQTSVGVRVNKVYWYRGAVRQVRITPSALAPDEFKDIPRE